MCIEFVPIFEIIKEIIENENWYKDKLNIQKHWIFTSKYNKAILRGENILKRFIN